MFLSLFESVLGNFYFLLVVISLSFTLKSFLLVYLVFKGLFAPKRVNRILFLLVGVLVGSMVSNLAWILKLVNILFFDNSDTFNVVFQRFILPIAWLFPIIEYQSMALFLERLADKDFNITLRRGTFLAASGIFFISSSALAIISLVAPDSGILGAMATSLLTDIRALNSIYCLFPLLLTSLSFVVWSLYSKRLPRILTKQLSIIIKVFVIPNWALSLIQLYPFNFSDNVIQLSYAVVGLSAALNTCALYFCTKKIIGLRFLNFNSHVQTAAQFNFVNNFKSVLEQFSLATSNRELIHISQTFLKENFNIPLNRSVLYIRNENDTVRKHSSLSSVEMVVETYLATQHALLQNGSHQAVLITDEIEFSNFYESNAELDQLILFLEAINADVFLPIYKNDSIIAYIIIDRYARATELYSHSERDELLLFAHYLGNMIHLLKTRQLDILIQQEQDLKEELYNKHQEINQYKESIRSFLRTKAKDIGIIFYKNRRFIFGNETAQELTKINLNTQEGHPLTREIKRIATRVEEYKSPQNSIYTDANDCKLVISGVPNLEKNNVIITIYPPDISDIIKKQINMLKDPSKWDYLLYLESTKSGQLINQLIPGSGETLLNFKIDLLKLALSKSAILLDMPHEDLLPTVEILHHISLRETLHILTIQSHSNHSENAIKLFGINPIFGITQEGKPLLEKLDGIGTLFIENIHLLEIEAQEYLAEYLSYGFFRTFKSDQKRSSSVRIICSSNQNLAQLVQEGKFSATLFNELKQTTLVMPSLLTIPEEELSQLAEGFSHIALSDQPFTNLLELTDKEKHKIASARPVSLHELKHRVQQLLEMKSKKNHIEQDTHFDPGYDLTNPELIQAARMGKSALKDQRIMTMLWSKFKNQNKIATFLGVNRSSVNRRCREFNLE